MKWSKATLKLMGINDREPMPYLHSKPTTYICTTIEPIIQKFGSPRTSIVSTKLTTLSHCSGPPKNKDIQ
jgi:hypothetical protein